MGAGVGSYLQVDVADLADVRQENGVPLELVDLFVFIFDKYAGFVQFQRVADTGTDVGKNPEQVLQAAGRILNDTCRVSDGGHEQEVAVQLGEKSHVESNHPPLLDVSGRHAGKPRKRKGDGHHVGRPHGHDGYRNFHFGPRLPRHDFTDGAISPDGDNEVEIPGLRFITRGPGPALGVPRPAGYPHGTDGPARLERRAQLLPQAQTPPMPGHRVDDQQGSFIGGHGHFGPRGPNPAWILFSS